MKTILERANVWMDFLGEDVEEEIESLPDANQLPAVAQAREIVKTISKEKLDAIVAKVADAVKRYIPAPGEEIEDAEYTELPEGIIYEAMVTESIKDIVGSLKGLADPKVIMAVIALMGAANSTDAGILDRFFHKDTTSQEQVQVNPKEELRNKIMEEFDSSPTAKYGYAHIVIDGKNYFVGKGLSTNEELARDKASMNSDEAMARAGHEGDEEIEAVIKGIKTVDEFKVIEDEGKTCFYVVQAGKS